MLTLSKKIWFFALSFLFILANSFFLYKEQFALLLAPLGLTIVYFALFKMDALMKMLIFFVPLSMSLNELEITGAGELDMALPTEPILFGLLILFIIKLVKDGTFNKDLMRHPVTISILINLVWIAFTVIPSVRPDVSIKFLVGRLWFIVSFYFILSELFRKEGNMTKFFWYYIVGFVIVIGYTLIHHSSKGFDQESANWIMSPFFNDHTSYGAAIAFLMPFLTYKLFSKELVGTKRLVILLLFVYFIVALVFSYTRAAWLSVLASLAVFLVLKLKVKWWLLFSVGIVTVGTLVMMWSQISVLLESNKQDSSTNLTEHVSSMSNVSSDASNLERINRWKSAYEMFIEKPVFGWGPGVYAFEYAPFQRSYDKTIISTNAGDGGNAHSEYLGPLSETGVLGSLTFLTIVISTTITGVRVYKKAQVKWVRSMAMVSLLGLISYYVHGILNNFLDTDKISTLFWGMTVIIVLLDIKYVRSLKKGHVR